MFALFTTGTAHVTNGFVQVEEIFQDLNLIYCELTSFLVLASSSGDHQAQHPRRKRSHRRKDANATSATSSPPLQVSRVSDYVVKLLQGESLSGPSQTSLARPITSTAYSALLPTIWSLLSSPSQEETSGEVLRVVVEHAIKASSSSVVKRSTVDFLARLILLEREAEYSGTFAIGRNSEEDIKLQEWILHLPKTLWELGASHLPTTETILRFLLRLCQRGSALLRGETLSSLRARLVPYFIITHATRGRLPGPYARLPPTSALRRLVLDVVVTASSGDDGNDALKAAVDEAVKGTEVETYWKSVRR